MTMRLPTGHQQPRRTATIERYHVYGTSRYELQVTYRGHALRWGEGIRSVAILQENSSGQNVVGGCATDVWEARLIAERLGFTHVRITGDWDKRTKPQGGAL